MAGPESAPFALAQLDVALVRYTDEMTESVQAGDGGRAELLLRVTDALETRREEVIDNVVLKLNDMEDHMALAQAQADRFLIYREKLSDVYTTVRLHILNYIDKKLPEDNRKLAGKLFWLRTQPNGGAAALEIPDETKVPKEYFTHGVKVELPNGADPAYLRAALEQFYPGATVAVDEGPAKLNTDLVREALLKGTEVPGASLNRGRHLRFSKPTGTAPARRAPSKKKETAEPVGV